VAGQETEDETFQVMYSLGNVHCIYLLLGQLCCHTFLLGMVYTQLSLQKNTCLDCKGHTESFQLESTSLQDKRVVDQMVKVLINRLYQTQCCTLERFRWGKSCMECKELSQRWTSLCYFHKGVEEVVRRLYRRLCCTVEKLHNYMESMECKERSQWWNS